MTMYARNMRVTAVDAEGAPLVTLEEDKITFHQLSRGPVTLNTREQVSIRQADAEQILHDLFDREPCRLDQDGDCQEHGWFDQADRCPHARIREYFGYDKAEASADDELEATPEATTAVHTGIALAWLREDTLDLPALAAAAGMDVHGNVLNVTMDGAAAQSAAELAEYQREQLGRYVTRKCSQLDGVLHDRLAEKITENQALRTVACVVGDLRTAVATHRNLDTLVSGPEESHDRLVPPSVRTKVADRDGDLPEVWVMHHAAEACTVRVNRSPGAAGVVLFTVDAERAAKRAAQLSAAIHDTMDKLAQLTTHLNPEGTLRPGIVEIIDSLRTTVYGVAAFPFDPSFSVRFPYSRGGDGDTDEPARRLAHCIREQANRLEPLLGVLHTNGKFARVEASNLANIIDKLRACEAAWAPIDHPTEAQSPEGTHERRGADLLIGASGPVRQALADAERELRNLRGYGDAEQTMRVGYLHSRLRTILGLDG